MESFSPMRNKLFAVVLAVVAATAVVFGPQTAAQAEESGFGWVQQDTDTGYCRAEAAYIQEPNGTYAYATFFNNDAGWACTGWLERSTNGGQSWYLVSGYHTIASSASTLHLDQTDIYWDGPGYEARACFHLNFSGAAHHCSGDI